MNYKAIFLDLDGTLLNSEHQLPELNRLVIQEITATYRIPVILISGRPPQGMQKYHDLLGLKTPMISYNGSLINDPVTNKVIYENTIDLATTNLILDHQRKQNPLNINYFSHYEWYCTYKDQLVYQEEKIIEAEARIIDNHEILFEDGNAGFGFHKILGIGQPEIVNEALAYFQSLELPVFSSKSNPHYLDFNPANTSKGVALQKMMDHYNWLPEEVIAIGDGNNDIEMLKLAGNSVVMENADNDIKQYGNHIAPANNDCGAGRILAEWFAIDLSRTNHTM